MSVRSDRMRFDDSFRTNTDFVIIPSAVSPFVIFLESFNLLASRPFLSTAFIYFGPFAKSIWSRSYDYALSVCR